MLKFRCVVQKTESFIVNIDPKVINEEFMEQFNEDFYEIEDLKGHAGNIALQYSQSDNNYFVEGYGEIDEHIEEDGLMIGNGFTIEFELIDEESSDVTVYKK